MTDSVKDDWAQEAKKFYDAGARWKTGTSYRRAFVRSYQRLISRFPDLKGKSVLDLGCGPAFLQESLKPINTRVIGADLSHESLKIARSVSADSQLLECDFTRLPLADNSMDYVFALTSLEFCKDKKKALGEISRVLHDRGQLYLEVRNRDFLLFSLPGIFKALFQKAGFLKSYAADGFRDLNSDEWVSLLQEEGFSVNGTYTSLRPWNYGNMMTRLKNILISCVRYLAPWRKHYMIGLMLTRD